jgi:hypothetical protein
MDVATSIVTPVFTNGVPPRKIIVPCAKLSSMLFIPRRERKIRLSLLRIDKNQNKIFFVISVTF